MTAEMTQDQFQDHLKAMGLTQEAFDALPEVAKSAILSAVQTLAAAAAAKAPRQRVLTPEQQAEREKREAARAEFVKYSADNKGIVADLASMGGEVVARVLARVAKRLPYQVAAEITAQALAATGEDPAALALQLSEVKPRKKRGEADTEAPEAPEATDTSDEG